MTHPQNNNSSIVSASCQTSGVDNIPDGFGMNLYICFDKRKKLTGESWQHEIVSKFNPHRVPPPLLSVWRQHPMDPVDTLDLCRWLTGTPPTIFLKLTFALLLLPTASLCCSGFWESLGFYSFLSRVHSGVIYFQMNSTWSKLTGHTAEPGRKDTLVYRGAAE